jgi:hypothetical protein
MALEAAEGMSYLHHCKVVHLDVKPLNFMVRHFFTLNCSLPLALVDWCCLCDAAHGGRRSESG